MDPPYRPLSACALLDGVFELEKFFDHYKNNILSTLRGGGGSNNSPSRGYNRYHKNNDDDAGADNNNAFSSSPSSSATGGGGGDQTTTTARAAYRTQLETDALNERLFGIDYGVMDVMHHLFTRHGTSHTLLDAIEHLNLLIPNWHEPRKNNDGSLLETPEMRLYALKSFSPTEATSVLLDGGGGDEKHKQQKEQENQQHSNDDNNNNSASRTRALQDQSRSGGAGGWRKHYSVADICDLTSLKNDAAVVRLLERDRGFGTKLWRVNQALAQDSAPSFPRAQFAADLQTKKPYGWRARLKFATALRAIIDRDFVSPQASEEVRRLEQEVLPTCSFEPHDLTAMATALSMKLELEADKATREEMIEDLAQQMRAMESFIRTLENDQQHMSEDGEVAQLKHAAVQQLEWYERLLRALENQFDVACDDVKSVEEARKKRNWDIFRQSKGDLPCVQSKVRARMSRLHGAAAKVQDLLREKSHIYEADLKHMDSEIERSTKGCVEHLGDLTNSWNELIDAIQKAAAAEKKVVQIGASLRATVEDRLNLIGARALKDSSHSTLLKAGNDILLDFAEENERLKNSDDFLSELHSVVCSGAENVTEQYDSRREQLLAQAEKIRKDHEVWMQEYSVALGRHRHRISSALSDAENEERSAEMRREISSDILDVHTRNFAIQRNFASTNKVKLRSELAALDGTFHVRNDEFRKRGVALNAVRDFVHELMRRKKREDEEGGETKMLSGVGKKHDDKKNSRGDEKEFEGREREDPMSSNTNIDLVNLTALHHLEKEVRNKYEVAGRSKQEEAMRQVMWERDRIAQAKEATRVVRRVPLGSISTATSPPPFLSPAPPRCASAATVRPTGPRAALGRGGGGAASPAAGSSDETTTATKATKTQVLNDVNTYNIKYKPVAVHDDRTDSNSIVAQNNNTTSTSSSSSPKPPLAQKSSTASTARPQTAPQMRSRTGAKVSIGQCLRVVFPFHPRVDDELKLERGDTVIVLRHAEDPGWIFGVCQDRMGQAPLNYLEAIPS